MGKGLILGAILFSSYLYYCNCFTVPSLSFGPRSLRSGRRSIAPSCSANQLDKEAPGLPTVLPLANKSALISRKNFVQLLAQMSLLAASEAEVIAHKARNNRDLCFETDKMSNVCEIILRCEGLKPCVNAVSKVPRAQTP
jgi:hypothetical protein